jgi:hypothetical protein
MSAGGRSCHKPEKGFAVQPTIRLQNDPHTPHHENRLSCTIPVWQCLAVTGCSSLTLNGFSEGFGCSGQAMYWPKQSNFYIDREAAKTRVNETASFDISAASDCGTHATPSPCRAMHSNATASWAVTLFLHESAPRSGAQSAVKILPIPDFGS